MTSLVNGSLDRSATGAAPRPFSLGSGWREHFLNVIQRTPRFSGPRRYLQADIAVAMAHSIHHDASVLEVGVGRGKLLAALPNEVRWGIDILPEAVEQARKLDPAMYLSVADAMSVHLGRQFDAIVCDRLCHSVPDVQRLLQNLLAHLAPKGRIFLTAFNFLWSWPLAVGEKLGFNEPSPPKNWLSASDLENLFALTGLESIQFDDRLLLPAKVPLASRLLNRYAARLPPTRSLSIYRLYTLRA